MKELENQQEIQELNAIIGLANPKGDSYKARAHKQQQMIDYYTSLKAIIKKLSTKRTLYLYDCGCGRSCLSFYLNYFLKKDGWENIQFICIDTNEKLIERCRETARRLGMDNMSFHAASIQDFAFPAQPEILYSLHACDSAIDQMIYQGIKENARHILSVSCCQHTNRKKMKGHPMVAVTRHGLYKERLTDMVADSLRALLLEAQGYKVNIFEFVNSSHTPKNVMVRCEKIQPASDQTRLALEEYDKLSALFNFHPKLETYLQEQGEQ